MAKLKETNEIWWSRLFKIYQYSANDYDTRMSFCGFRNHAGGPQDYMSSLQNTIKKHVQTFATSIRLI